MLDPIRESRSAPNLQSFSNFLFVDKISRSSLYSSDTFFTAINQEFITEKEFVRKTSSNEHICCSNASLFVNSSKFNGLPSDASSNSIQSETIRNYLSKYIYHKPLLEIEHWLEYQVFPIELQPLASKSFTCVPSYEIKSTIYDSSFSVELNRQSVNYADLLNSDTKMGKNQVLKLKQPVANDRFYNRNVIVAPSADPVREISFHRKETMRILKAASQETLQKYNRFEPPFEKIILTPESDKPMKELRAPTNPEYSKILVPRGDQSKNYQNLNYINPLYYMQPPKNVLPTIQPQCSDDCTGSERSRLSTRPGREIAKKKSVTLVETTPEGRSIINEITEEDTAGRISTTKSINEEYVPTDDFDDYNNETIFGTNYRPSVLSTKKSVTLVETPTDRKSNIYEDTGEGYDNRVLPTSISGYKTLNDDTCKNDCRQENRKSKFRMCYENSIDKRGKKNTYQSSNITRKQCPKYIESNKIPMQPRVNTSIRRSTTNDDWLTYRPSSYNDNVEPISGMRESRNLDDDLSQTQNYAPRYSLNSEPQRMSIRSSRLSRMSQDFPEDDIDAEDYNAIIDERVSNARKSAMSKTIYQPGNALDSDNEMESDVSQSESNISNCSCDNDSYVDARMSYNPPNKQYIDRRNIKENKKPANYCYLSKSKKNSNECVCDDTPKDRCVESRTSFPNRQIDSCDDHDVNTLRKQSINRQKNKKSKSSCYIGSKSKKTAETCSCDDISERDQSACSVSFEKVPPSDEVKKTIITEKRTNNVRKTKKTGKSCYIGGKSKNKLEECACDDDPVVVPSTQRFSTNPYKDSRISLMSQNIPRQSNVSGRTSLIQPCQEYDKEIVRAKSNTQIHNNKRNNNTCYIGGKSKKKLEMCACDDMPTTVPYTQRNSVMQPDPSTFDEVTQKRNRQITKTKKSKSKCYIGGKSKKVADDCACDDAVEISKDKRLSLMSVRSKPSVVYKDEPRKSIIKTVSRTKPKKSCYMPTKSKKKSKTNLCACNNAMLNNSKEKLEACICLDSALAITNSKGEIVCGCRTDKYGKDTVLKDTIRKNPDVTVIECSSSGQIRTIRNDSNQKSMSNKSLVSILSANPRRKKSMQGSVIRVTDSKRSVNSRKSSMQCYETKRRRSSSKRKKSKRKEKSKSKSRSDCGCSDEEKSESESVSIKSRRRKSRSKSKIFERKSGSLQRRPSLWHAAPLTTKQRKSTVTIKTVDKESKTKPKSKKGCYFKSKKDKQKIETICVHDSNTGPPLMDSVSFSRKCCNKDRNDYPYYNDFEDGQDISRVSSVSRQRSRLSVDPRQSQSSRRSTMFIDDDDMNNINNQDVTPTSFSPRRSTILNQPRPSRIISEEQRLRCRTCDNDMPCSTSNDKRLTKLQNDSASHRKSKNNVNCMKMCKKSHPEENNIIICDNKINSARPSMISNRRSITRPSTILRPTGETQPFNTEDDISRSSIPFRKSTIRSSMVPTTDEEQNMFAPRDSRIIRKSTIITEEQLDDGDNYGQNPSQILRKSTTITEEVCDDNSRYVDQRKSTLIHPDDDLQNRCTVPQKLTTLSEETANASKPKSKKNIKCMQLCKKTEPEKTIVVCKKRLSATNISSSNVSKEVGTFENTTTSMIDPRQSQISRKSTIVTENDTDRRSSTLSQRRSTLITEEQISNKMQNNDIFAAPRRASSKISTYSEQNSNILKEPNEEDENIDTNALNNANNDDSNINYPRTPSISQRQSSSISKPRTSLVIPEEVLENTGFEYTMPCSCSTCRDLHNENSKKKISCLQRCKKPKPEEMTKILCKCKNNENVSGQVDQLERQSNILEEPRNSEISGKSTMTNDEIKVPTDSQKEDEETTKNKIPLIARPTAIPEEETFDKVKNENVFAAPPGATNFERRSSVFVGPNGFELIEKSNKLIEENNGDDTTNITKNETQEVDDINNENILTDYPPGNSENEYTKFDENIPISSSNYRNTTAIPDDCEFVYVPMSTTSEPKSKKKASCMKLCKKSEPEEKKMLVCQKRLNSTNNKNVLPRESKGLLEQQRQSIISQRRSLINSDEIPEKIGEITSSSYKPSINSDNTSRQSSTNEKNDNDSNPISFENIDNVYSEPPRKSTVITEETINESYNTENFSQPKRVSKVIRKFTIEPGNETIDPEIFAKLYSIPPISSPNAESDSQSVNKSEPDESLNILEKGQVAMKKSMSFIHDSLQNALNFGSNVFSEDVTRDSKDISSKPKSKIDETTRNNSFRPCYCNSSERYKPTNNLIKDQDDYRPCYCPPPSDKSNSTNNKSSKKDAFRPCYCNSIGRYDLTKDQNIYRSCYCPSSSPNDKSNSTNNKSPEKDPDKVELKDSNKKKRQSNIQPLEDDDNTTDDNNDDNFYTKGSRKSKKQQSNLYDDQLDSSNNRKDIPPFKDSKIATTSKVSFKKGDKINDDIPRQQFQSRKIQVDDDLNESTQQTQANKSTSVENDQIEKGTTNISPTRRNTIIVNSAYDNPNPTSFADKSTEISNDKITIQSGISDNSTTDLSSQVSSSSTISNKKPKRKRSKCHNKSKKKKRSNYCMPKRKSKQLVNDVQIQNSRTSSLFEPNVRCTQTNEENSICGIPSANTKSIQIDGNTQLMNGSKHSEEIGQCFYPSTDNVNNNLKNVNQMSSTNLKKNSITKTENDVFYKDFGTGMKYDEAIGQPSEPYKLIPTSVTPVPTNADKCIEITESINDQTVNTNLYRAPQIIPERASMIPGKGKKSTCQTCIDCINNAGISEVPTINEQAQVPPKKSRISQRITSLFNKSKTSLTNITDADKYACENNPSRLSIIGNKIRDAVMPRKSRKTRNSDIDYGLNQEEFRRQSNFGKISNSVPLVPRYSLVPNNQLPNDPQTNRISLDVPRYSIIPQANANLYNAAPPPKLQDRRFSIYQDEDYIVPQVNDVSYNAPPKQNNSYLVHEDSRFSVSQYPTDIINEDPRMTLDGIRRSTVIRDPTITFNEDPRISLSQRYYDSQEPRLSQDPRISLSQDPRMSLSQDPRMSTSQDPRISLSQDPRMSLSQDPRMSTSQDPRISLFQDPRISVSQDPRMSMSQDPRMSLTEDPRISLSQDPRMSVSQDPRISMSQDPRISVSQDPRMSVSQDPRISLSQDRRMSLNQDATFSEQRDQRMSMGKELRISQVPNPLDQDTIINTDPRISVEYDPRMPLRSNSRMLEDRGQDPENIISIDPRMSRQQQIQDSRISLGQDTLINEDPRMSIDPRMSSVSQSTRISYPTDRNESLTNDPRNCKDRCKECPSNLKNKKGVKCKKSKCSKQNVKKKSRENIKDKHKLCGRSKSRSKSHISRKKSALKRSPSKGSKCSKRRKSRSHSRIKNRSRSDSEISLSNNEFDKSSSSVTAMSMTSNTILKPEKSRSRHYVRSENSQDSLPCKKSRKSRKSLSRKSSTNAYCKKKSKKCSKSRKRSGSGKSISKGSSVSIAKDSLPKKKSKKSDCVSSRKYKSFTRRGSVISRDESSTVSSKDLATLKESIYSKYVDDPNYNINNNNNNNSMNRKCTVNGTNDLKSKSNVFTVDNGKNLDNLSMRKTTIFKAESTGLGSAFNNSDFVEDYDKIDNSTQSSDANKCLIDPIKCSQNTKKTPCQIRYAQTVISKFQDFTIYEVMKSSDKKPTKTTHVTEGVFVVKKGC